MNFSKKFSGYPNWDYNKDLNVHTSYKSLWSSQAYQKEGTLLHYKVIMTLAMHKNLSHVLMGKLKMLD